MDTDAVNAIQIQPAPKHVLGWLGVVGVNLWVPLVTLLETVLGILISPILFLLWRVFTNWSTGKIMRHFVYMYGAVWRWLVTPFVRIESRNLHHQSDTRPCVMVVNHWSLFDIFLMSVMRDFDVIIYLRSWPFKMRWFAPFMNGAEYQDIESLPWDTVESRTSAFFKDGLSIMVFPEGHRSRTGRMGRFYSGAFRLSLHNGIPIVPVCIKGSDQLLPPGRRWLAPARIRIDVLEPIDPQPFNGELAHIELRKHVKAKMESCLAGD